jgi:hypothetical protein
MTRRQLARNLSANITKKGDHFINGSTIWCTQSGEWGALAGTEQPPPDTEFYAIHAWRPTAELNTVLSVEDYLAGLQKQRTGIRVRVDRKSLKARK